MQVSAHLFMAILLEEHSSLCCKKMQQLNTPPLQAALQCEWGMQKKKKIVPSSDWYSSSAGIRQS